MSFDPSEDTWGLIQDPNKQLWIKTVDLSAH